MDWASIRWISPRKAVEGESLQLRVGLLPPAVSALHRVPGHGDHDPRARACLQYLNGVAATCLYDNMKIVVSRYEGGEPIYNTRFLAFATHYGFRPVACRPRRPQTKGKVERQFRFVGDQLAQRP